MQISEEAVEAAAKALWGHGEMPEFGWDQLDRVSKKVSLDEARAALEAAGPYLKAEAWDEGWQACVNFATYPEIDGEPTVSENPYRSQA